MIADGIPRSPDPSPTDPDAVPRSAPFLVDYMLDGRTFSFVLLAPGSWADAQAHLAAIKAGAMIIGSDVVEIPATPATLRLMDVLGFWTDFSDALLNGFNAQGAPQEMALAGAAVLASSCIVASIDRATAGEVAAAVLDASYAVGK